MKKYDAIIVGGGPAGMNAALILGRCRRSVLLFDTGKQRNLPALAMHGFLTRDGIPPGDFISSGRKELKQYHVEIIKKHVKEAVKENELFKVVTSDGRSYSGRKLLLATGMKDNLPEIEGFESLYGCSVHHCPICDGWEHRDEHIAVYGKGKGGYDLALAMLNWSRDVILCTDGKSKLQAKQLEMLEKFDIPLVMQKISRLEGKAGKLSFIHFRDGSKLKRDCLFFANGAKEHSCLAGDLGCRYTSKNELWVDRLQQSNIEGVYICGDATHEMKLVIIAAAEGARAGVAINLSLMEEDRNLRLSVIGYR